MASSAPRDGHAPSARSSGDTESSHVTAGSVKRPTPPPLIGVSARQIQRAPDSPWSPGSQPVSASVRESTLHLASLPFSPNLSASASQPQPQLVVSPMPMLPPTTEEISQSSSPSPVVDPSTTPSGGTRHMSSTSISFTRGTPKVLPSHITTPSALSMLMAEHGSLPPPRSGPLAVGEAPPPLVPSVSRTPGSEDPNYFSPQPIRAIREISEPSTPRGAALAAAIATTQPAFDDQTPILTSRAGPTPSDTPSPVPITDRTPLLPSSVKKPLTRRHFGVSREDATVFARTVSAALPAVFLGMLLNILDGVSYGLIMFPPTPVFEHFGGIGVSMFFASTIVSQLVYTLGASGFAGANGSMIIEVVPFFHMIGATIISELGPEADPRDVIATTLAAFALSSILTGIAFILLGKFKLGNLISFFPRHILIGCIGGVGWFLIETGLEVCGGLKEESFQYNWEQFEYFFLTPRVMALWLPAMLLAILLRVITHRWDHQLIFPSYFIGICAIFYIVVGIGRFSLTDLRQGGWVFDLGDAGGGGLRWYEYLTYYDFRRTSWYCLWITMPTQFALLFFNLLHPPLNVPALAISIDQEVDTNKELVAHGYSNIAAGLCGTVPNYIVYVNSLLFYRVGGGSRIAGMLLAIATFGLLVIGPQPIAYIPVLLVGALIFVLGIDLVKEAVWDTRNRVSRFEYLTIWFIILVMSVFDFVVGVLAGVVFCCLFFVIQTSQTRSIRTVYTGTSAMSNVRRPAAHREYIRQVANQTVIMRLQGHIFFGTISKLEDSVRQLLEEGEWARQPIRFLVLDFSLVLTVDISAAEALVRLQRLLDSKSVMLIFSGMTEHSAVWRSLHAVDIFTSDGNVESFDTVEQAIEWTENAYIRAWFMSQSAQLRTPMLDRAVPMMVTAPPKVPMTWGESFGGSPRRSQLRDAGQGLISRQSSQPLESQIDPTVEPLPTLLKVFWSFPEVNVQTFSQIIPYLKRVEYREGATLWEQGDAPDGLYFVETGMLRAVYDFGSHTTQVSECMVAGTVSGELSALSGLERNSRVFAERKSVLWKLSTEDLVRMREQEPQVAIRFTELIIKVAKVEYDILLSSLAGRA